jgi:hypothetical protein
MHGVLESHYLAFCQALLDTFQETAGTRFDDQAKQAWSSLLAQVSSEMKNGAHETGQLISSAE